MEMQFNISMDSHYGWIRLATVASFCGEGVRVETFYFTASEDQYIIEKGKSPPGNIPTAPSHYSSSTSLQTSEEQPATVGITCCARRIYQRQRNCSDNSYGIISSGHY
jgi:hypothetical protein